MCQIPTVSNLGGGAKDPSQELKRVKSSLFKAITVKIDQKDGLDSKIAPPPEFDSEGIRHVFTPP